MPFTVEIKTPTLPTKYSGDGPRRILMKHMTRAANEMVTMLRAEFIKISPIGATGLLRSSWQTRPARPEGRGVKARVSSTQIPALVFDKGAKPHRPPSASLEVWVRRKLNAVTKQEVDSAIFTVSRAIARRGLPSPRNRSMLGLFTRRARRLERTRLKKVGERMVQQIIQELDF